jgi:hypothetical protein
VSIWEKRSIRGQMGFDLWGGWYWAKSQISPTIAWDAL